MAKTVTAQENGSADYNTFASKDSAGQHPLSEVNLNVLKEIVVIPMSFETGEQTTTKIYFNHKVTVNKIRSIVVKALAGTNSGTITAANSSGDMASGVCTHAQSAALNDEQSASPTTNNVIAADGYVQLTSAKVTAGGKVLVTLEVTRTA